MCRRLEFPRQEIYEIVIAGNSTMRELFFDLDVQTIGERPYKSQIEHEYLAGARPTTSLTEDARRLRLWANPKAKVWGAPLIASHVGADMAADLVAVDMESQREVVMLVDIGTNTEVGWRLVSITVCGWSPTAVMNIASVSPGFRATPGSTRS